jgi:hypothetical protein
MMMLQLTPRRTIEWPMASFGPVNLWRVCPAWQLAARAVTALSADAVRETAPRIAAGIHPRVAQLLSVR